MIEEILIPKSYNKKLERFCYKKLLKIKIGSINVGVIEIVSFYKGKFYSLGDNPITLFDNTLYIKNNVMSTQSCSLINLNKISKKITDVRMQQEFNEVLNKLNEYANACMIYTKLKMKIKNITDLEMNRKEIDAYIDKVNNLIV